MDNRLQLENADPVLPDGVFNRLADNWRPLFTVAQIAGGDWSKRCVAAFTKLTSRQDVEGESIGAILLSDIRQVFMDKQTERIFSRDLVEALCEMKERPWPEVQRGRPLTERWLAHHLARFGIHTKTLRIGEARAKGYEKADFQEAFERYGPGQFSRDSVTREGKDSPRCVTTQSIVTHLELPASVGMSRCHAQNRPGEHETAESQGPIVSMALKLFNGTIAR